MIDNFPKLENYFNDFQENDFLFVQIIQRKKEIPELGCNNRLVKSYTPKTYAELLKYKSEIVAICLALNARAYIHLSPRNFKKIQSDMLTLIAEYFKSETYQHIPKLFNTVCGKSTGSKKLWIFDLDTKENTDFLHLREIFYYIEKYEGRKILVDIFPTKNGSHFITNGFDVSKYTIPIKVELHKNNPTILFVN